MHFKFRSNNTNKIPLAPMGVLAPGSAHSRPSAQPSIDNRGNFSKQVSGGGGIKKIDHVGSIFNIFRFNNILIYIDEEVFKDVIYLLRLQILPQYSQHPSLRKDLKTKWIWIMLEMMMWRMLSNMTLRRLGRNLCGCWECRESIWRGNGWESDYVEDATKHGIERIGVVVENTVILRRRDSWECC